MEGIFSRALLIKILKEKVDYIPNPWEPSDYCYNRTNKGIVDYNNQIHIFERVSYGKYKVLGIGYDYNGEVYNGKGKCVGKWDNGKLVMCEDIVSVINTVQSSND